MSSTRRVFLLGATGSSFLPRLTWAQQAKATPRIGWISIEAQPDPFIDGFREGLRRHGYVEGTNVILDLRYSPGHIEGLTAAVADLIQRKVLFIGGDPVELGLANSLNKPGRNFTGSTFMSLEIAGKRVELIKEAYRTPITRANPRSGVRPKRQRALSGSRSPTCRSARSASWTPRSIALDVRVERVRRCRRFHELWR
jgi:putative tryptophan/tyrosine transport system substrate-binding protein